MPRSTISQALCTLALLAASAAQAAPISLGGCGLADLSGSSASDCLGYARGNDGLADLQALVGGSTWHGLSLAGLTQFKDESKLSGSSNALFDVQQSPTDESQGRLVFLQSISGPAVLTLKGGANWAAYYLPQGGVAGASISFDIPGVQAAGLSHASIFTASTPVPAATAVPEPSGLALALLALAGLAASARCRRHPHLHQQR